MLPDHYRDLKKTFTKKAKTNEQTKFGSIFEEMVKVELAVRAELIFYAKEYRIRGIMRSYQNLGQILTKARMD